MENSIDLRLRADRAFIEYLCAVTGKTASAIAKESGMAPTTLNRYLSKKIKLKSTLKDSTIQKIAQAFDLDHVALVIYRKRIEDALRQGKSIPEMRKSQPGLKESPLSSMITPDRDPLMDQIMGATYDVWFSLSSRDEVEFDRLPGLVRLLYGRARAETKAPNIAEIKKRAADMLAVAAMEGKKRK